MYITPNTSSRPQRGTATVTQEDVLYVAYQVSEDLQAIQSIYPELLTIEEALQLNNSFIVFLHNQAITESGFCIYDSTARNLVYHEVCYHILYRSSVAHQRSSTVQRTFTKGKVPASATFTSWVIWSERMLHLQPSEQDAIVSETLWRAPYAGEKSMGRYGDGGLKEKGEHRSGFLKVNVREWKRR